MGFRRAVGDDLGNHATGPAGDRIIEKGSTHKQGKLDSRGTRSYHLAITRHDQTEIKGWGVPNSAEG